MRKSTFCIYENKGADQLRGKCEADQRLCFHYMDRTFLFFLNPNFQPLVILLSSPLIRAGHDYLDNGLIDQNMKIDYQYCYSNNPLLDFNVLH